MNKINNPLIKLTKKIEKTQISKIRNDQGEITTDSSEIQMNTKECLENVYFQN